MLNNQIPEQEARENIDWMLENSGWAVQNKSKGHIQLDEVFFSQML